MAANFVTDMGTTLALSIMFIQPTIFTLVFYVGSILIIILVDRFSPYILNHPILASVVIASAVISTFIAQKWFMPVDDEDILDFDDWYMPRNED